MPQEFCISLKILSRNEFSVLKVLGWQQVEKRVAEQVRVLAIVESKRHFVTLGFSRAERTAEKLRALAITKTCPSGAKAQAVVDRLRHV